MMPFKDHLLYCKGVFDQFSLRLAINFLERRYWAASAGAGVGGERWMGWLTAPRERGRERERGRRQ